MKRRHFVVLWIAVALAACATRQSAGPALSGEWAPESAQLAGQAFPIANFAGATLRLTAGAYEFGGDKGTIALHEAGAPAQMDITGREGPNAGRTIQAIYELVGDQLTVCYQLGQGARPIEFTSPPGSQVLLVRYRRIK